MSENSSPIHYVYILVCSDQTLYTGYTTDPQRRLAVHNSGKGAKYTKVRRPVRLVYTESYPDKSQALKREAAIKRLSRAEKLKLIAKRQEIHDEPVSLQ